MTPQQFTTHINTLYFFTYNLKNAEEKRKPVKKYTKGLTKLLGIDFIKVLNSLVENGTLRYSNYGDQYYITPVKEGAIDITSIYAKKQPTDQLIIGIRETLRRVSLKEGIEAPIFFRTFLKHKNQYLNHFFNQCQFAKRLHTPVSNLHRVLRPHLLIDEEPTAHIDINTAQPLFLARTLNEVIGSNEFTDWVYRGTDVYNELLKKSNFESRDIAKKEFLRTIFNYDLNEIIELYGNSNWAKWINWYKSNPEPRNPKIKSWNENPYYNNLAWLLQNLEVQTMRKVWQKLAGKKIPFLTVHDSIICKQKDHAQALEIFNSVMSKEFIFYKLHSEGMPEKSILPPELISIQMEYLELEQKGLIQPQHHPMVKDLWNTVKCCIRNNNIGLPDAINYLSDYRLQNNF